MQDYVRYLIERFGIPEKIAKKFNFVRRGKSVWAYTGNIIPDRWESLGVRAFRLGIEMKPTTDFLRIVGRYATKNVVLLLDNDAKKFMRGESLECSKELHGYIIVRTEKYILGCGLCKNGKLISMIPKKYRFQRSWV